ncbi:MAG: hypothetical protein AAEJ65_03980, partial [Planctomycetota bacterium]
MKKTGSTVGNRTAVALLTLAFLLLGVVFAPQVLAQDDGAPVTETVSVLDNIKAAGWVGVILILMSITGVSFIIIYAMQMRRDVLVPPELLAHVEGLFDQADYDSALDAMEQQPCYLSSVLSPGLLKINRPFEEVEDAMEEAGEMEAADLHRKISYISLIAAIAPMLG